MLVDRQYLRQLASAVAALHSADIQHCDIKPENIFLGFDSNIRLADFGESKRRKEATTYNIKTSRVVPKYSSSVDSRSVGQLNVARCV